MKIKLVLLLILCVKIATAQITLADFETVATAPVMLPQGVVIVQNPDKNLSNSSEKVGLFNKPAGDWKAFYLQWAQPLSIPTAHTDLTFKIRSDFEGRVFVKIWNGSQVVIENWAPDYNFMVTAGKWTDCTLDISTVTNKTFTHLEININGGSASGKIYFDDFKLTHPLASSGMPVAHFTASRLKPILGETLVFDASASYDFNGNIIAYRWDFGDGTTGLGKVVSHRFAKDGVFKVRLTVVDNDNNESVFERPQAVFPMESKISHLNIVTPTPSVNSKVEGWFVLKNDYQNVYNPDEVLVNAHITLPDQTTMKVPCFYYVKTNYVNGRWREDADCHFWALRFSSPQIGLHKIVLTLTDTIGKNTPEGEVTVSNLETTVYLQNSPRKGIIGTDPLNKQFYRHNTGEPYFPQGINIAWDNVENYTTIIDNLAKNGANYIRYWHAAFNKQHLEWKNNGFNSGLGIYSQGAAAMQDFMIDLCTQKNISLQMCIFHHGMFSENVNSNWSDNPYNIDNGGYLSRAEEFFYNPNAKKQVRKLLRYLIARWGYSPNLLAWELFNEVQFTGIHNSQTAKWRTEVINWHDEMGQYIKQNDPFKHIIATSADDSQLIAMNNLSGIDNVQYHTYNNAILDNLALKDAYFLSNIRQKSVICGEYGAATNADVPFDIQRHAIWTGITAQVPHIMWEWNHYTDEQWSTLFKQPAAFLKNEDIAREGVLSKWSFTLNGSNTIFKTSGFSTSKNNYYGYAYAVFNQDNMRGVQLTLPNMPKGTYRVQYFIPDSAQVVVVDSVALTGGVSLPNQTLMLPAFSKGIGIKMQFLTDMIVSNKELIVGQHKIRTYPNPVSEYLILEFETGTHQEVSIQLIDMQGRAVMHSRHNVLTQQQVTIQLHLSEHLSQNGIYLIYITNGDRVFRGKVVYQQ